jgi:polyisoprenoid-binding protein YceI
MRLTAVLLFAPILCAGADYRLQPEGNPLRLMVDKTGIYSGKTHVFEFHGYSGAMRLEESQPSASTVSLVVKAADFRLMDEWVNEKDRQSIIDYTKSDKVLDVARFPEIQFRSTSAEKTADGWRVTGQLEIRKIEKPVVLTVGQSRDGDALTFTGRLTFGMKQFGIKPPSAALGLIGTKDEMRLEFNVKAVR